MVPSKKHPLEIFRELGSSNVDGSARKRRKPKQSAGKADAPARQSAPRQSVQRQGNGRSSGRSRSARGNGARSPGDFKIVLTLNQVLVSLVVLTVLVLGGYFAGYYRGGGSEADGASLSRPSPSTARLKDPAADRRDARSGAERGTQSSAFGVLSATYDLSRKAAAEEACRFFREKGFKKVLLLEYKKSKKYAIVIGSYDRQNHRELIRLLEVVQAIDDFPSGEKAPFRDARIERLPQVKS